MISIGDSDVKSSESFLFGLFVESGIPIYVQHALMFKSMKEQHNQNDNIGPIIIVLMGDRREKSSDLEWYMR